MEPRLTTIEGRKAVVTGIVPGLPRGLGELLAQMSPFGFTVREDFTLAGARTACEVLRVHRWRSFREGHWHNPRPFPVPAGGLIERDGQTATTNVTIPQGTRRLRLRMCADCGAVAVHDITPEQWAGARPMTLVNRATGQTRIAPTFGQPDVVIGWYSGKRRAGREYR